MLSLSTSARLSVVRKRQIRLPVNLKRRLSTQSRRRRRADCRRRRENDAQQNQEFEKHLARLVFGRPNPSATERRLSDSLDV